MSIKIKVCGMRDSENIRALAQLQPDYMGFIFFEKSKRDVYQQLDKVVLAELPTSITKVGVFVNASLEEIQTQISAYALDMVQLHGKEAPELCKQVQEAGTPVAKAFSVDDNFDFSITVPYKGNCDFFLFDTKGKEAGGNGFTFNWSVLDQHDNEVPFFLSGGLDKDNIKEVLKLEHLNIHAVDVNSKFEIEPALKDIELLKNSVFKALK